MWEKKEINSLDGIPITYYKIGNSNKHLVFLNAVGASILLWIPIINSLSLEFTIISMEYRGFPGDEIELNEEQCKFMHLLNDLLIILNTEKIDQTHIIAWCYGQKLMLEFYRHSPERCLSLCLISMGFGELQANNNNFSKMIYLLRKNISEKPESFIKIITILRKLSILPEQQNLQEIITKQYSQFDKYDFEFDKKASTNMKKIKNKIIRIILSILKIYKANKVMGYMTDAIPISQNLYMHSVINLKNYFNLLVEIGNHRVKDVFDKINIPFTLIYGGHDKLIIIDEIENILQINPNFKTHIIEDAAHFNMASEHGINLLKLIQDHLICAQQKNTHFTN